MSKFSDMVPLSSLQALNAGLHSATEATMISVLGSPIMPLTIVDQPNRVSPVVKPLLVTKAVTKNIRVTGIKPAVDSLQQVLDQVRQSQPDLIDVLGTAGMINVRLRKPTTGPPSTEISNHAWGTAIDFNIDKQKPPGNTGKQVPLGIAILVPFFNKARWFSGISFADAMHFEASDELVHQWAKDGLLGKQPPSNAGPVVAGPGSTPSFPPPDFGAPS